MERTPWDQASPVTPEVKTFKFLYSLWRFLSFSCKFPDKPRDLPTHWQYSGTANNCRAALEHIIHFSDTGILFSQNRDRVSFFFSFQTSLNQQQPQLSNSRRKENELATGRFFELSWLHYYFYWQNRISRWRPLADLKDVAFRDSKLHCINFLSINSYHAGGEIYPTKYKTA